MPRTRTRTADMLALARADLVGALDGTGVRVSEHSDQSLALMIDGSEIDVAVIPVAYATRARVGEVLERSHPRSTHAVLVADRITADARELLTEAGWGWLDRRGHVHLRAPGILIDLDVEPSARAGTVPDEPIRGRAGLAVAYRLLTTNRGEPISPRRSSLPFAPSTICEALSRLRAAALVDPNGAPLLPELFWVIADHWRRDRVWLAPSPRSRT